MTLLVSWASIDTHGPAGVYVAADSRISWGTIAKFDYGRKVFAFRTFPDIVGYCGDVLFPSMVIAQLVEMADNGLLFAGSLRCKDRFEAFKEKLVQQCHRYPRDYLADQQFEVIYAGREANRPRTFFCHLIAWSKSKGWSGEEIELPQASAVLRVSGSGANSFRNRYTAYEAGPTKGTSRAVFHCFCNTLFAGEDPLCGGAPQLVGVYCKPNSVGIAFGIIRDKKRYLYGAEVDKLPEYSSVEWRNDYFERCEGASMKILPGAQEQPDPLRTQ
jgi:hypothetical protein